MKKNTDTPTDAAELRRRAEQELQAQKPAKNLANGADTDVRKLLQELQVHQIELEMQNEELRQARTEVDALLAHYTELHDLAPVGYFTLDSDSIIRQTNLAGAKMLGVERGKLLKRRLGNFVDEKNRIIFSEFLGRVFAGKTREACDLTLICTGNMPRLVHIEAGTDETGQTCHAAMTDITEFRAAQQQLARQMRQIKNAELEWESVFDSVLDPIFLHDKELRILRCNKAYQQCAGIPFGQIIGQPYYEVFPKTAAPLPSCLRTMEKTEAKEEEEEVVVGDASYRSRSFSVQDEQGIYLYSVHILEDITERKRAETAFRERNTLIETLLENAPIGFAMNSMDDGRVTYVSRRFAEIYGVPPGTLATITDFFENVYRDPVFREQIRARVLADISSGDATRMHWEDVPIITASGETRFVSASNIPLPEQNLMISMVWDVTDRYKAAADLAEQVEELRRWHDATLGREMRILELKSEVNELLKQAGQPPRYSSAISEGAQEK